MSYVISFRQAVPALARKATRADVGFKRLLFGPPPRRLRSTVTSTASSSHHLGPDEQQHQRDHLGSGSRSGAVHDEISVDFEQTQEAYKSKDSLELLRSLVVFKLCSFDFLVDKNKEVKTAQSWPPHSTVRAQCFSAWIPGTLWVCGSL